MAKEIKLVVDDDTYNSLSAYALITNQTLRTSLKNVIGDVLDDMRHEPENEQAKYTFIDLFAGIGGMRLAYEAAGCACVYSSE